MTFRTTARTVAATAAALLAAVAPLTANAQTPPSSQWRASPITLSSLLQDGYKIVAVVNGAHVNGGSADTIFVQRDQSAFKCVDPQQPDAKSKTPATPPACFELVPPSGASAGSEAK
ncbi:hypothetical protein PQR66_15475 [Paraburkholderia agricolaris]|uniref:Secreted protein n=1 Tax=Paraburkholderia agricolaris TaxID=2152888 RepID=A0ABW8ZN56_9BURK